MVAHLSLPGSLPASRHAGLGRQRHTLSFQQDEPEKGWFTRLLRVFHRRPRPRYRRRG